MEDGSKQSYERLFPVSCWTTQSIACVLAFKPKMSDSSDVERTAVANEKAYDDGKATYRAGSVVSVREDFGADCELQRRLSTRHITMIALGSSIGMGLWLGSGSSLASGGPASIWLGYILSGTMIWAVSHSIGEMAVMYPLPSAVSHVSLGMRESTITNPLIKFVQWSNKFVDPAAGFALGWSCKSICATSLRWLLGKAYGASLGVKQLPIQLGCGIATDC